MVNSIGSSQYTPPRDDEWFGTKKFNENLLGQFGAQIKKDDDESKKAKANFEEAIEGRF
jgi:hypothetical protein